MLLHGSRRTVLLAALALLIALTAAAPAPAAAAGPDLSLRLVVTPDPAIAGRPVVYTATVTNDGDAPAYGVSVLFIIVQPVSVASAKGCPFENPPVVQCTLGVLAPHASASIPLELADVHQGSLQVTASAGMVDQLGRDVKDPTQENNSVAALTVVNQPPDLKLALTTTPDPATVGENVTITADVADGGLGPAPNAMVQVVLPDGAKVVSMPDGCAAAAGKVTCTLGTLAPAATASRAIVVGGLGQGVQTILASVSSDVEDAAPSSDRAQASFTVEPRPPGSVPTANTAIGRLLAGLPKPGACIRGRTLVLRIRPQKPAISAASIYLGGVRVRHRVGDRLLRTVTLQALPRKGVMLKISDELTDGRMLVGQRRLTICPPRRHR